MSTYQKRYQYIFTFLSDFISLVCAIFISRILFDFILGLILVYDTTFLEYYLLLGIAFVISFICFDRNVDFVYRKFLNEIISAIKSTALFGAVAALLMLLIKLPLMDSRYFFFGILLFYLLLKPLFRTRVKRHLKLICKQKNMARLTCVLTVKERAETILRSLKDDWTKELCGVAFLDAMPEEIGTKIEGVPIMGGISDFMTWVRREALDEIYIDIPSDRHDFILAYLVELKSIGLDIHLSVPVMEMLFKDEKDNPYISNISVDLEHKDNAYMLSISAVRHSIRDLFIKRLMDICGSLVGIIISIPIIAIVAIPLKLESHGPLFFKQKRVGLNGRYFYIYKLRSMYEDAEERKKELQGQNEMNGQMFKMHDDPRVTKVGRVIRAYSIDELPQFFNVLRGDMSLVGTRPPTVDEFLLYESYHKRRLSMKPGITGLWQISGRSDIKDFEDVVRLDLEYIDKWSLKLDCKILFKTVGIVINHSGAR